jgi:hypothetical protein
MKDIPIKQFAILLIGLSLALVSCDQAPINNCTVYEVDKFLGNYNVSEFCQQGFGNGLSFATINPGSAAPNELSFENFLNSGQSMKAYIDCNGTYFRIPQQNLGSTALTVVGEGNFFDTGGFVQLQFEVQLNQFGQANFCTYTYSK